VVAIAANAVETCALLEGGTVECWGEWATGSGLTPTPTPGLSGVTALSMRVDGYHGCALLSGGTVMCWGLNGNGQLGDGTTNNTSTPVPVSNLSGVLAVAAGGSHTCALLSGGTVECWGNNIYNEVGETEYVEPSNESVTTPAFVYSQATGATAITAGDFDSCALGGPPGAEAQCWGYALNGELGSLFTGDTYANAMYGTVVSNDSGDVIEGFTAIVAGGSHTCSLGYGMSCWGSNSNGQLGINPVYETQENYPYPVSGVTGVAAIAAGGAHTCVLLAGGTVECWGSNSNGQLGNGSDSDTSTPVTVSNLSDVTFLAAGGNHNCALLAGGVVECWGSNSNGQLGTGNTNDSSVPVPVHW
jgi:alpha-tubulin suppressor-like RCC1 family protein